MANKKKDVAEQTIMDNAGGTLPNDPTAVLAESEGSPVPVEESFMDLNELLGSMDSDPDISEPENPLSEPAGQEGAEAGQDDSETPDGDSLLNTRRADTGMAEEKGDNAANIAAGEADTPRTKRTRKKKEETPAVEDAGPQPLEDAGEPAAETMLSETSDSGDFEAEAQEVSQAPRRSPRNRATAAPVLTIESRGEVETEQEREDTIWHEIHNAYRTRRMLTGQLGGIEQTESGKTIAIADYKGFRIVIPLKEMMINLGRTPTGQAYTELMLRQNKILGNMLGAEIDFIIKGIDSKSRSVVASRKEAMLKKRQIFYLDTDAAGIHRIYERRIVQARVIAVAEKVIRVEAFGAECSIMARDLAWDWIGDAHERFSVGDQVLVRILSVRRDNLEELGIKADIKSVSQNTNQDNLKKCRIQSKYAGKVTDVHKGIVYIRLSNGVNAVAHACYDQRTPGKKDDVSFAVTKLDEDRGVAVGIITRIIRQNL